ncbi:MAG TPA: hypothetical protein ENO08_07540 [Candidatus Eisenbacteria bacterium]|uniref:DUF1573 domain-containing protein n=1 Tax=Eiseniibacteriota bacterium TaxID=2212470 RepID=A0A7V2AW25_UNCEI|nr:hypothetical protein [Candidatus Eisenbacteria bacterium]
MRLSRKLGLPIAATALIAVLALAAVAAQKDPPKMYIRDMDPDIGTFYEGADIDYTFTVRNNGVSELHILGVRPG